MKTLRCSGPLLPVLLLTASFLGGCYVRFQEGNTNRESDAQVTQCGDGVREGAEECDGADLGGETCWTFANLERGELTCSESCTLETAGCFGCGDGRLEEPEGCDDGNQASGDGCASHCQEEEGWQCEGEPSDCETLCGDGIIAGEEACDSGEAAGTPGCPDCTVAGGWECTGEPSVCTPLCGDGRILGDEECDDGDRESNDGCDASCDIEGFTACHGEPSQCHCVVYVDVDNAGLAAADGASWATALPDVQAGITQAADLGGCEVWVAEGTYHIYQSGSTDHVALASGVAVYGGFLGSESALTQRNPIDHASILDGRIAGGDNRVEHVVQSTGVTSSRLDGFTITRGDSPDVGGGLQILSSTVTVAFCRVQANNAAQYGAGIYASGSVLSVQSSIFSANATIGSGDHQGGAIYTIGGELLVEKTVFLENGARWGGALLVSGTTVSLVNAVLVGNTAENTGSAIQTVDSAELELINCTVTQNVFTGAEDATVDVWESTATVVNTIIYDNAGFPLDCAPSSCDVSYSLIEGGFSGGTAILDADPRFVAPLVQDYRLQPGSPCIDAGSGDAAPATDLFGFSRVDDPDTPNTGSGSPPYTDLGAYEYQP